MPTCRLPAIALLSITFLVLAQQHGKSGLTQLQTLFALVALRKVLSNTKAPFFCGLLFCCLMMHLAVPDEASPPRQLF